MDKQPTLLALWGAAVVLGLVGYAAARWRRWLVIPVLALIAFLAWSRLGDLADPVAGPAILQAAGRGYLIQACAALALAVILAVIGLAPRRGAPS
ncbi:MAG TPA: hypothetical protein VEK77_11560 [Gemmatimonadales bacterium]|nr:hypothetical protein [Gemmatimonadales bacterium]